MQEFQIPFLAWNQAGKKHKTSSISNILLWEMGVLIVFEWTTLPKTNITPDNGWLEDDQVSFWEEIRLFSGPLLAVSFREWGTAK